MPARRSPEWRPRCRREHEVRRRVTGYAELGQALSQQILEAVEPGRHYKVMEVCGGRALDLQVGLDDLLPENMEPGPRAGLPGMCGSDGRVNDGIAMATENDVDLRPVFGDMMRVPGSEKTYRSVKAEGADIRMRLLAPRRPALCQAEPPDRKMDLLAIGFETTAPSTALTLKRAKAEGAEQLSVHVQPHNDRAAATGPAGLAGPAAGTGLISALATSSSRRRRTAARVPFRPTTASPWWSRGSSRWTSFSRSR